MTASPLITLNNCVGMPALGRGVLDRDTRELTAGAVEAAIRVGYRLIDTAQSYLNEKGGRAERHHRRLDQVKHVSAGSAGYRQAEWPDPDVFDMGFKKARAAAAER